MARTPKNRTTKLCPVCGFARPLDDFYRIKAKRYAGGYRYSELCIEHTEAATGTNLRARLQRDPTLRERQRIAKQESACYATVPRKRLALRDRSARPGCCSTSAISKLHSGRLLAGSPSR